MNRDWHVCLYHVNRHAHHVHCWTILQFATGAAIFFTFLFSSENIPLNELRVQGLNSEWKCKTRKTLGLNQVKWEAQAAVDIWTFLFLRAFTIVPLVTSGIHTTVQRHKIFVGFQQHHKSRVGAQIMTKRAGNALENYASYLPRRVERLYQYHTITSVPVKSL